MTYLCAIPLLDTEGKKVPSPLFTGSCLTATSSYTGMKFLMPAQIPCMQRKQDQAWRSRRAVG